MLLIKKLHIFKGLKGIYENLGERLNREYFMIKVSEKLILNKKY